MRTEYINDAAAPKANSLVPAVVAILVNTVGSILLQRRTDNGLWALPGGTMEIGETVGGALVREVREETGLNVAPGRLLGIYSDPAHIIAYSDGEVRQQFAICFVSELLGGELRGSGESLDIRFVPLDETSHLPMHPSTRLRIQHYRSRSATAEPYFT